MAQKRLSKDEARELILSTAEKRFETNGLEGLKLADIGRDAGITHSNILHHFGSREGLNAALIQRMTTRLATEILENIESTEEDVAGEDIDRTANLKKLFETLSQKGHARLITWMLTMSGDSDREMRIVESLQPLFDRLCDAVLKRYAGGAVSNAQTMRFFMLMVTTAAVGDGVAGSLLKKSLRFEGPDAKVSEADYLNWLATVFNPD